MLAVQNRRYSLEEVDARHFKKVCVVAHILAITELLLIGFWMNNFCGGFQWNGPPEAMFTYHPLFMTFSLQFLLGEAIMIYRMLRYVSKKISKCCHIVLHSIVFIFFVIALKAVFNSHNYSLPATPNLYTLHSWLGMTVVLIFCMQYIFGFMAYFYPGFTLITRQIYLPIHKFIGIAIFIASTGAALMGISEKAAWHIKCWSSFCSEGLLANFSGLVILFYALAVVYLVVCERFRRESLPQEEEEAHDLLEQ